MNIVKRDGSEVKFNKDKIKIAVEKAMKYGTGIYLPEIASLIADDSEEHFIKSGETPGIKEVETYVYNRLVFYGQLATAKAYEGYRSVQEFKRESNTTDDSILDLLNRKNEDVMMENSNKNPVVAATQRDLIAGEVSKDIARRKLIPAYIVQAHDEGAIHYHK